MDEILSGISKLFKKCGIKNINMDDIARELGISKKTLYQQFENKNDVIYKVTQNEVENEFDDLNKLLLKYSNAINQLYFITKYIVVKLNDLTPSLTYEMNKYYPQIWGKLKSHRNEYIQSLLKQNFQLGIRQGMYRENLNTDANAVFHTFLLDIKRFETFKDELKDDLNKVFKTLFLFHLRGIATSTGMEYIEQLFNNLKNEDYL